MAWEDIAPPVRTGALRQSSPGVTISARQPSPASPCKIAVNLNLGLTQALGWEGKQRVKAQLDRETGLAVTGKNGKAASIYLPALTDAAVAPQPASPARHEVTADGALVVDMPGWALAPAAPAAPAPRPAPPATSSYAPPPPVRMSSGSNPGPKVVITKADQDARIRGEVRECLAAGMRGRKIAEELGIGLDDALRHIAAIEAETKRGKAA